MATLTSPSPRTTPLRNAAAALVLAMVAALAATPTGAGSSELARVIVRGAATFADAAAAVVDAGGAVVDEVDLIDAVIADVPAERLAGLDADDRTAWVHADRRARLQGEKTNSGNGGTNNGSPGGANSSLFGDFPGALGNLAQSSDVAKLWSRGLYGAGVGIALIDSGVTPVPGLDAPGQVVHGPDFSVDADDPGLRHLDAFGHGTHLAGIIAGRDPGATDADVLHGRAFSGLAPGARLVSVKVAGADGATDMSRVLQALDWVVDEAEEDGLDIRVVELALAVAPAPDHRDDPLSAAVEAAWRAGVVVVVAAGNTGDAGISSPAYNPWVIAVGAVDQKGTARLPDDTMVDWSAVSSLDRSPDVVAMGHRLASLRVDGSLLHNEFPQAEFGERYLLGSGTSQASAVVASMAALLVEAHPDWGPDRIKHALRETADSYASHDLDPARTGRGLANAEAAADHQLERGAVFSQSWPAATGGADLHFESAEDVTGAGESGSYWDAEAGTWLGPDGTVAGTSWGGTSWGGTSWGGTSWGGTSWG